MPRGAFVAFDEQRADAVTGKLERGDEPDRTATDDHYRNPIHGVRKAIKSRQEKGQHKK